jgi:hypothetical protein
MEAVSAEVSPGLANLELGARQFLRTAIHAAVAAATKTAQRYAVPVKEREITQLVRRALDAGRSLFAGWGTAGDLEELALAQQYRWSQPTGRRPGLEESS